MSHFKAPCNIAHDKAVPHVTLSRTAHSINTGFQAAGNHKPCKILSEPGKQEVSSHEICPEGASKAQVDFVPPGNCKAPSRVDPAAERIKDCEMDSSTRMLKTVSPIQDMEETTVTTAVRHTEWTK